MKDNEVSDELRKKVSLVCGFDITESISSNYLSEPRGRFHNYALFVIRPRSTDEVSKVVELMNLEKVGIVPFSGGTGLVAGQIAAQNKKCVLISLDKMSKVRSYSREDESITVEAGMILANLKEFASIRNLVFPLSLASEGSCQIGGNLATNAGGVNVVRYGNVRDFCLGLEVVLADGSIFNGLKSLHKDNTGYDLRHLMIGSEGTLGIITAATLKLFPKPQESFAALIAVDTPKIAVESFKHIKETFGSFLQAYELISSRSFDYLKRAELQFSSPFKAKHEWYILIEIAGNKNFNLKEIFEKSLNSLLEKDLLSDAVIAQNERQAEEFWKMREQIPEANRRIGAISSHDISLPISNICQFLKKTGVLLNKLSSDIEINCFGHLGDGNLHYNIFPPVGKKREDYEQLRGSIKKLIHDTVYDLGGSFSAEHGIGRLRVDDFNEYSDLTKIKMMVDIKNALDPVNILNPGSILNDETLRKEKRSKKFFKNAVD